MTKIPGRNPYRPGAATPPLFLAGRDDSLKRFARILESAPEIPANLRITGLRGVGKSVLLRQMEEQAQEAGWVTYRFQAEPRHNHDQALRQLITQMSQAAIARMSRMNRLRSRVSNIVDTGRKVITVKYEDITFGLGGSTSFEAEIGKALYDTVDHALISKHRGFLLAIDEAQVFRDDRAATGEHPLSTLVAAVNTLQEAGLPFALVLCGLPSLRSNLQHARTYSERMFRGEEIGALSGNPGPAADAFIKPLEGTGIEVSATLVERVLAEVEGYPFFIQVWGAELWDAARDAGLSELTTGLLDSIEGDIYRRLDEEFYRGRVDILTPSEQDLILATANCSYPPLLTAEVQQISKKKSANINVIMGRLTEQGVIYRIQKGSYEYTAPKFHDYLLRRVSK